MATTTLTPAHEALIAMGHTQAEIAGLPAHIAARLALALPQPRVQSDVCCPVCGRPAVTIGLMFGTPAYNCDHADCQKGQFSVVSEAL